MRAVLWGDVIALARAVLAAPAIERDALLLAILAQASAAESFRLANRTVHPRWGNGSVMAAAMTYPMVPEPPLGSAEYRALMCQILRSLAPSVDHALPR